MSSNKTAKRVKYLAIGLGLLVVVRLSLPFTVQWYINDTLDEGETFTGLVGDVDIMLWRGAYALNDVVIMKRNGKVNEPFFEASQVDFSLLWPAIFDGALVAEVYLQQPQLNFVDGGTDASSQSGEDEKWLYLTDQLVPLKVDRLEIEQGVIRFQNPDTRPPISVRLHHVNAVVKNLVNSRALSRNLIATVDASASTESQGTITLSGSLNPATKQPTFDLNLQANDIALVNFRNLLDTYAPFDLEAGKLELAFELASEQGEVTGYAKPVLHDVEVFSWKGDVKRDDDGFFRALAEAFSGFIAEIFENQGKDQIATRIPISGSLNDIDTPVLTTLAGILENAFIQAFNGNLENSVEWQDVTLDESEDDAAEKQTTVEEDI
ncbi:MAG: DUF748 domain-containing protein [Pseudomonadota bacterium]|uniref:DUF748 domain-containing protein n=1 Tax=Alteromonas alba TaxID=2079529 RepID=A0A2S9VBL1_9ALTE|nr:DUF748 domain-containing protein [Alteromonas alba]MAJ68595.1 hypothetical protein [Alteromonadaceae bacterium]MCP4866171.1 DUF748 domain-containing protein [Alteromonas sp.]MDY6925565.1 DUF748 domain-containing protein [Pseudomonadota bacterium]RPH18497.1 MAG: DUF748 domain-containing protein [Alteromonadaceae bacterium TMED7]PRO73848.1 hypothetical protein C6Y40_09225 [Alteromonas alba]